ncbi:2017_t:CDS:2 [Dentiscutata heterogama]|uniref:2017_t:CDS:1 n=1 Tax=Dentiscutata heterogama TaxID=1316150 RepID=A0ACA9K121_9GLOM|nr:2017_t:CDS:2 [Dentiscutata heterogama]
MAGEMERDCLVGYGASMLLMKRSSDQFDVHVLKNVEYTLKNNTLNNFILDSNNTVI